MTLSLILVSGCGSTYVATFMPMVRDADYIENPTSYQIKKGLVTGKSKIKVDMARGGGFAISCSWLRSR